MKGKRRGKASCKTKYQKVARISPTGYLNFLREYKRRFCGLSPQEMIRFGAIQWNKMPLNKKEHFKNMGEPVIVIKSPPKKFENHSTNEISNCGKACARRSPYAREKESTKKSIRRKSTKCQQKPKASSLQIRRDPNTLGSAIAYIYFLRKFQKLYSNFEARDLLKKATRLWCRLEKSQRQQFERPIRIIKLDRKLC
ncbi:protamine-like protein 99C [Drosophila subpulchrella]|uniref:protamine-like protein 99C n=1 Tax=Drosophila subpulchrella TaxID=1486046 RepID=UPI0018A1370A|nr:protamine-like protein 99C [Drosophila subpulchrella]